MEAEVLGLAQRKCVCRTSHLYFSFPFFFYSMSDRFLPAKHCRQAGRQAGRQLKGQALSHFLCSKAASLHGHRAGVRSCLHRQSHPGSKALNLMEDI